MAGSIAMLPSCVLSILLPSLFALLPPSLACFPTGDNGFITTTTTTTTTTLPTTTTTELLPCRLCDEQELIFDPFDPAAGDKEFDSALLFVFEGCLIAQLICVGEQATIEFNLGANGVLTDPDIVVTQLVCNDAGDAWVLPGDDIPIFDVTCATVDRFIETPECKTCNPLLVDTTPVGGLNEKPFDSDVVDTARPCAVRILTCIGQDATIEFNRGMGVVSRPAGSVSVTATLYCNAAGTGWYFNTRDPSQLITAATCATV